MIRIRNRLDQPLVINRGHGRILHLLAGGSAVINDEELKAPAIQALLNEHVLEQREFKAEGAAPKREEQRTPRRKDN